MQEVDHFSRICITQLLHTLTNDNNIHFFNCRITISQIKSILFLAGGNLTYEIPRGVADDHFVVDPIRGIVTTRGKFDREIKDLYTVPVYVMDTSNSLPSLLSAESLANVQFDVATIVVKVTDVNDHAPEFRSGSCYPLAVPENSDMAVVHTVVATDLDDGPNGEITYSITGKLITNFVRY